MISQHPVSHVLSVKIISPNLPLVWLSSSCLRFKFEKGNLTAKRMVKRKNRLQLNQQRGHRSNKCVADSRKK